MQLLANKKALMLPIVKQDKYYKLWQHIQKETHFTDRNMYVHFPQLWELVEKENCENVTIGINTTRRKFLSKKSK
jgi:hypothetical protein